MKPIDAYPENKATATSCEHPWEDITWEDRNDGKHGLVYADGNLYWYGICKCGQRVVESFISTDEAPEAIGEDE